MLNQRNEIRREERKKFSHKNVKLWALDREIAQSSRKRKNLIKKLRQ